MRYDFVLAHKHMLMDERRNGFYQRALMSSVTPESVVLDLGAGLGIHGLMAAKLRARRVFLVDPGAVLDVTKQIVAAQGLSDRVECHRGRIEDVELPEQVDIITSVFTGNFLLGEDLLPSLFFARDKYLRPSGLLIPDRAVMEVVPVEADDLFGDVVESWSVKRFDLNFELGRRYAANSVHYYQKELREAEYLAEPADIQAIDFRTAREATCRQSVTFVIGRPGTCHGFAGWFRMRLGDEWLSTAPQEPALHWSAVFLPLDPPVEVSEGLELYFALDRPQYGNWTWRVRTRELNQVHSTFFSKPMQLASVHKYDLQFAPVPGYDGTIARYILQTMDGVRTVAQLAEAVRQQYPTRFTTPADALAFVRVVVSQFGS